MTNDHVFLSYAKEDRSAARKLYADLIRSGISVWFDEESLEPGQDWILEIEQAIQSSKYFVVLLSNNSVSKQGIVQKEVKRAIDKLAEFAPRTIFLIPCRLEEVRPAYKELERIHWVDLFPDYERGLSKLVECITRKGGKVGSPISEKEKERNAALKIELHLSKAKKSPDADPNDDRNMESPTEEEALIKKADEILGDLAAYLKLRFIPFVKMRKDDVRFFYGIHPRAVGMNSYYYWFKAQFPKPGEIPTNYYYFVVGYDFDDLVFQYDYFDDSGGFDPPILKSFALEHKEKWEFVQQVVEDLRRRELLD